MTDERFEVYLTVDDWWAVVDTETNETITFAEEEDAQLRAEDLNEFPWTADSYGWNLPKDAPERYYYETDVLDNLWAPEVVPRPEIGEARQLATGLAMLGYDKASTTILNLIKLVEDK